VARAERLLTLLEHLRAHRYPVSGAALAASLGISRRTLYRDIAALQRQGARIVGEAGVGYVLRPGYTLPPLAFSDDELDALLLGARWVADRSTRHGDAPLAEAARRAVAKIGAVLPPDRRAVLDAAVDDALLLVNPGGRCAAAAGAAGTAGDVDPHPGPSVVDLTAVRDAIRRERKLGLTYRDSGDRVTTRTVWPVALAYFARVQVLVAWCEIRAAYRHFRPDRSRALAPTAERYPRRRHVLLAEWRAAEAIDAAGADPLVPRLPQGAAARAQARLPARARPVPAAHLVPS
jgi:predicted DNA-binding transcriptional regulator YafY